MSFSFVECHGYRARWRSRAYEEKRRMVTRLQEMATDCFDRLIIEEEEKFEAMRLREAMHQLAMEDDPTATATAGRRTRKSNEGRVSHAEREDASRDKILGVKRSMEMKRMGSLLKKIEHQRDVEAQLLSGSMNYDEKKSIYR